MRRVASQDILSNWRLAFFLYGLPVLAISVTGRPGIGDGWRTLVWTSALAIMGAACIVNTVRCGRVHCYVTGPFFMALALVTLLYGLGIVPLGRNGWNLIGWAFLAGAVVLCFLPELFWGRYRKNRASHTGHC